MNNNANNGKIINWTRLPVMFFIKHCSLQRFIPILGCSDDIFAGQM